MNTKKIKLYDHHYSAMMPRRDPSPARQFPASPVGLCSPFHQGLLSSAPHHEQYRGSAGAGWPREEYAAPPRPAFAQSCVGSSTAAFYAAENLLGTTQFDCAPLGMFPAATTRTPFRSSAESELYLPQEPSLMLRAADQSSSVRTYYVRPQRRDAAELPLRAPAPQQQERAHHDGLFANTGASSSLPSQMEQHLPARSLVSAPATVSHASGCAVRPATPPASKTRIRWTQGLHERFVECVNQLGGANSACRFFRSFVRSPYISFPEISPCTCTCSGDAEGDPEADELGRPHHLPHQEPPPEIPYGQVHATTIFTIRR